ncbi:MAG: threonine-phosphate decarboxylase [Pseudomonadota bacterium]
MNGQRDHGGGIDAAALRFGGSRADWLDLSTGINPHPYPIPEIAADWWQALPDAAGQQALLDAARAFWKPPAGADVLAAPGVSILIAMIPRLAACGPVCIPGPTYNEHAAAFATEGWQVKTDGSADAQVVVHPNNPDGRIWLADHVLENHVSLTIIDESFCDVCPEQSLLALADRPGVVVLKGLGKFWGLAGLRLGFAIAKPATLDRLGAMMGPWAVSGPAQHVGAVALSDPAWAAQTRARLSQDADRLDKILTQSGAKSPRGTSLFRLYDVEDAKAWQDRLARHMIWSRIFPWSPQALRLGLPGAEADWQRLEQALGTTDG